MSRFSGPPRDRPETQFSEYVNGLKTIAMVCGGSGFVFLVTALGETLRKSDLGSSIIFASFGIGFSLILVCILSIRALQKEREEISHLYVEFRGKQLRNILVSGKIYFLASDIVDSLVRAPQERASFIKELSSGRGSKMVDGYRFASVESIIEFVKNRDDRLSILLAREMRDLRDRN